MVTTNKLFKSAEEWPISNKEQTELCQKRESGVLLLLFHCCDW